MSVLEDLKEVHFFDNLEKQELEVLASFSYKKNFAKDEILFFEKDMPKHLTLLLEGMLKVYKTDNKNNEVIMHRFLPKMLIAERVVFEGLPYPASASFESDGSVLQIDFEKFKNNFLTNPDIAFNFFKSLSSKIKVLEDVIALNVVLDSTSRVAKYICEHEEAFTLKHTELAKSLHMAPETLSRIFKKFIKLGFLTKKSSQYKIVDKESLTFFYD